MEEDPELALNYLDKVKPEDLGSEKNMTAYYLVAALAQIKRHDYVKASEAYQLAKSFPHNERGEQELEKIRIELEAKGISVVE